MTHPCEQVGCHHWVGQVCHVDGECIHREENLEDLRAKLTQAEAELEHQEARIDGMEIGSKQLYDWLKDTERQRDEAQAALTELREGVESIANIEEVLAQKDRGFAREARIDNDQMIHLGRAQAREAISKELRALADGEREAAR